MNLNSSSDESQLALVVPLKFTSSENVAASATVRPSKVVAPSTSKVPFASILPTNVEIPPNVDPTETFNCATVATPDISI